MKKYRMVILLLLGILNYQIYAQNDTIPNDSISIQLRSATSNDYKVSMPQLTPMSPNAASLAQYVDYPVSHYTGVPNINIPLYEVEVDGFKLPISLSYHASGIRVDQEASWVGLGWALNAGGSVSRTVKCYDDFEEYDYPGINVESGFYEGPEVGGDNKDFFGYIGTVGLIFDPYLKVDSEPDIFYYTLPGSSGKFILDKSRGAVLFDRSHSVKITPYKEGVRFYFSIKTPDGVEYFFKDRETSENVWKEGPLTRNGTQNVNVFDEDRGNGYEWGPKHASSWLLSKIITVNGREINFSYKTESYISPTQESCKHYTPLILLDDCGYTHPVTLFSRSKTIQENLTLSRIDWDGGSIRLVTSGREDMIPDNGNLPQKLDEIRLYDKSENYIKSFIFDYSYFNDDFKGKDDYHTYRYKHVFKRLKLIGVTEIDDNWYYYNEKYFLNNGYKFDYYVGNLPAKNSKNTDYWGYYNGKSYKDICYSSAYYNGILYKGANKSSDFDFMKIATLNKIVYPTGGSTTFVHEANSFYGDYIEENQPQPSERHESVEAYNPDKFKDHAYEHLPRNNSLNFTIEEGYYDYLVNIDGYVDNLNCSNEDYDYCYECLTDGAIFKLRQISPRSRTITFNNISSPIFCYNRETEEGSERYFGRHNLRLEPGEYIIELGTPPKECYAKWTISSFRKVLKNNLISRNDNENSSYVSSSIHKGGGLRISKIIAGDKVRNFDYSTGKMLIDPVMCYEQLAHCYQVLEDDRGNPIYRMTGVDYFIQYGEPISPLNTLRNGNSIGYEMVKEYITDGTETSSTIYWFHNEKEELISKSFPFLPTKINYHNGLPIKTIFLKNNEVIKRTEYFYTDENHYPSNHIQVRAFIFDPQSHHIYPYEYNIPWIKKTSEKTTELVSGEDNDIARWDYFIYNDHAQLMMSDFYTNDASFNKKYFYPTDYSDDVSKAMVESHMIGVPIEILGLKEDYILFGKKTKYSIENINSREVILPKTIYTINTDKPLADDEYKNYYVPEVHFDKYNSYGKPLQVRNAATTIVYLWRSYEQSPVAEIKNATYEEVKQALGVNDNELDNVTMTTDRIERLRHLLPDAMVTVYKYLPLVGVSEIINPQGISTYYHYDNFGRLKEIYLKEKGVKKILQRYDYHYQNENQD